MKRKNPASGADVAQDGVELGTDVRAELAHAVKTVPEGRLREVVAQLAEQNEAIARAFVGKLLSADHETGALVANLATCVNCKEEFDPSSEREENECMYHKSWLEINYQSDVWDDTDDPGESLEDVSMQEEYPDGYMWSCCNENAAADGCIKGVHQAARKRARHDESGPSTKIQAASA